MSMKRVSDEDLIKLYKMTGNVWKTAKEVGLCGQSVHERLVRLKVINKMRVFTDKEKEELENLYKSGFKSGDKKLQELSQKLNRTIPYLCRQAKYLGYTNQCRKCDEGLSQKASLRLKEYIIKNGHSRGMLGKHHTQEMKDALSKKLKELYKNEKKQG